MTSIEYGRHARRILEWDEVELTPELDSAPVDLNHGSVFQVEEDAAPQKDSLLGSMRRLLNRKIS